MLSEDPPVDVQQELASAKYRRHLVCWIAGHPTLEFCNCARSEERRFRFTGRKSRRSKPASLFWTLFCATRPAGTGTGLGSNAPLSRHNPDASLLRGKLARKRVALSGFRGSVGAHKGPARDPALIGGIVRRCGCLRGLRTAQTWIGTHSALPFRFEVTIGDRSLG
jgi:hypothetical protein